MNEWIAMLTAILSLQVRSCLDQCLDAHLVGAALVFVGLTAIRRLSRGLLC